MSASPTSESPMMDSRSTPGVVASTSDDLSNSSQFGWADYSVFACLLGISAFIGIYFACCSGGRQKTQREWLSGDGKLDWIPTSLSLLASFISAITLLGTPSEIYMNGFMFFYNLVSFFILIPITALLFIPVFRKQASASVFVYLRNRFNIVLSLMACLAYTIQMLLYMGVVTYSPALALNAVTGLSLNGSIITVSLVCLFYTAVGGIKAIIWTDAVQTVVMIGGMITVAIAGTLKVGGFSAVFEVANAGLRLEYDNFSWDPRVRHSGFDLIVGGVFMWLPTYAVNQALVQRYVNVKTNRDAYKATFMILPGLLSIVFLSGYCGFVAFTKYALCDPLKTGHIQSPDQILPYFVLDTFSKWPGFGGLFVSCIFSGSLSSISTGVNALAGLVLTDLIPPKLFTEEKRAQIGKLLSSVFAIITVAFAFLCKYLGSILELAFAISGILAGPVLGLFLLGMLTTRSNGIGSTIGYLSSISLLASIYLGTKSVGYTQAKLILHATNCSSQLPLDETIDQLYLNQKEFGAYTLASSIDDLNFIQNSVFRLSYAWYGMLGAFTTITVGYFASLIVRAVNKKARQNVPRASLLFNFRDIFESGEKQEFCLDFTNSLNQTDI